MILHDWPVLAAALLTFPAALGGAILGTRWAAAHPDPASAPTALED